MKKSWAPKTLAFTAVSALLLAGCASNSTMSSDSVSSNAPGNGNGKLQIVTTFYPMYEFTKQVAGEHADVVALIPAGAEPHDWEPSAKDMKQIKEADVFVYNGIVEGWAEQTLKSAENAKRVVVEASKGIELMEGLHDEHEHGEHEDEHKDDHKDDHKDEDHKEEESGAIMDPHVWLNPVLAGKEVETIAAGLMQADPAHKDDYRKNADAYLSKLKDLDQSFQTGLASVRKKEFVTQHAVFGYLAKQYGLTQVPIAGLSPEEEPAPDQMAEIITFAKEKQVKTIFFETLVDPKVANTIAKEISAKTAVLNPLEGLTEEEQKNKLDYIGVMTKNLEALKKALNE